MAFLFNVTVSWAGVSKTLLPNSDVLLPPAHLYLLAIGIDKYGGRGFPDLDGAANDAQTLAQLFRSPLFSSFRADVAILTNEQATKSNIRAALQKWALSAGPEDMFILSFSGQQMTVPGANGTLESYMAPADSREIPAAKCREQKLTLCGAEEQSLISGSLLYSWMTQVRAKRQILLLDTGHTDLAVPVFERYWRKEACNIGPEAMKRILLLTNHGGGAEIRESGGAQGALSLATAKALQQLSTAGSRLVTGFGVQQAVYRQWQQIMLSREQVRADLLGGDFVISGPKDGEAKSEDLLLDSGLGPVCYDESGDASRGFVTPKPKDEKPVAPEAAAPKNYALVVATDDYRDWPHLQNPILDAETIGAELQRSYGFEVERLFNPTRQQLKQKLDELHRRQFGPDDQLFIFVAGHGDYDATNDIGYLVFKDASDGHDYDNDMNLQELRSRIDTISANHILLVMDSCFAGSLDPEIGGAAGRGNPYEPIPLEKLMKRSADKKTRVFLTSGSKEYVSDGQPRHHSPFAALFINALQNGSRPEGYLSIAKLPQYFQRLMTTARMGNLGHNQSGSEFFFVKKTSSDAGPRP